jgi:Type I phosphodiesterase / nucleotide pyrophosphatase
MTFRKPERLLVALSIILLFSYRTDRHLAGPRQAAAQQRRNIIIFVADGLRYGSVNEKDTPALWSIRQRGVHFVNSHSLFPTFTMVNASAIATGHGVGDTGNFGNVIWAGYPIYESGTFDLAAGTPTPFIENDGIIADIAGHYDGNYFHEKTLMSAAMASGYNVASIGKVGPTAIQHIEAMAPSQRRYVPAPDSTIIIDDATGTTVGYPLPRSVAERLIKQNLSTEAPERSNGYGANSAYNNGNSGNGRQPGTLQPNTVQQQWFSDVATKAVLPMLQQDGGKPFLMLYWSRDPDGTQHNQGDSLGTLYPGINGDTSKLGVQNADRNLQRLIDWLDANPATKANTDLFVTSDHGFATISRMEIDLTHRTQSESAKHAYVDANGNLEIERGKLPPGFLAIDLAFDLHTNLFDPDRHSPDGTRLPYRQIRMVQGIAPEVFEHPQSGNGLLGSVVEKSDGSDARLIVAANGGSDFVYVPDKDPQTVRDVVRLLSTYDYVGGIFVDDQYGAIEGTLPLSAIGLVGASVTPRPAIIVAFKYFYRNEENLQTAVQISDGTLQEGQGNHGGLGRDTTWNNMAAIGPDFKAGYVDEAPVSNADIAPTIAHILKLEMQSAGRLRGRVITEALKDGPAKIPYTSGHLASTAINELRTILHFQEVSGERYIDRGCFVAGGGSNVTAQCP